MVHSPGTPAACRRARGAGCDAAAIGRRDQSRAFSLAAIVPNTVVAACGSAPEDVLAIFDGEVLEIAEPGVDAFERLISGRGSIDASFAGEAAALRRFDDQSGKPLTPPAIKPIGLRIFIEQQFELMRVAARSARA